MVLKWLGRDIPVNDGGTTASNHSPDATLRVEHSKLKGSASARVELLNVSFLLGQIPTEGCRED